MAGSLDHSGTHEVKTELSRELTLFHVTMMGVGMMIGAGVFMGTGVSIGKAGAGGVLLTFAFNGIIALFTGLSYAELASAIPRAGGAYNYARIGFGKGISFLAGWMEWFASSLAGALYSVALGKYLVLFAVSVGAAQKTGLPVWALEKLVAVLMALVFIYVNFQGASKTGIAGSVMTVGQTLTLAVVALVGIVVAMADPSRLANFNPFLPNGWEALLVTMGFTYVAFEGYEVIVQTGDEAIDPRQNIPRAILWSLLIVVTTYLGLSFATVVAVKGVGMPAWQWIGQFGATGFAEAVKRMIPYGGLLVTVAILFSATSALNATIYSASRVSFALGRDRMLPHFLSRISPTRRIPHVALGASGFIVLLAAATLDANDVTSCADIMFLLLFFLVNLCVIRIRANFGDELKYGFLMPFYPLPPILAIVCQAVLAVWLIHMSVLAWIISGIWIGAAFFIYQFYGKSRCTDSFGKITVVEEAHEAKRRPYQILVPVGNPANAIRLIQYAIRIARARNGEILLLNMVAIPEQTPLADADEFLHMSREAIVEAAMYVPEEIPVLTSIRYCRNVARGIVSAAKEHGSDLIVLGWRGRTMGRDYILGSTIDPIVEKAPCETAVIKLGDGNEIRRILVPVAGGFHSHMAVRIAANLAKTLDGVRITVFHVLTGRMESRQAQAMLDELVRDADIASNVMETRMKTAPDVLEAVLKEAEDFDLVVLGATPAGMFRQIVFGSFPEQFAARCPKPVMMVKSAAAWKQPLTQMRRLRRARNAEQRAQTDEEISSDA